MVYNVFCNGIYAELIAAPIAKMYPLLNLSRRIPTNIGMNMYGIKFASPIKPSSEYDAPIIFFANIGSIGPCNPYEIPMIKPVRFTNTSTLFICMRQPLLLRP